MSTPTTPTPAPVPSLLVKFNQYLASTAAYNAYLIQKEQADVAAGDHLSMVNDAVEVAAMDFQTLVPSEAPMVGAALAGFLGIEGLVAGIVGLFRHPRVAAAIAASNVAPQTAAPTATPPAQI